MPIFKSNNESSAPFCSPFRDINSEKDFRSLDIELLELRVKHLELQMDYLRRENLALQLEILLRNKTASSLIYKGN